MPNIETFYQISLNQGPEILLYDFSSFNVVRIINLRETTVDKIFVQNPANLGSPVGIEIIKWNIFKGQVFLESERENRIVTCPAS